MTLCRIFVAEGSSKYLEDFQDDVRNILSLFLCLSLCAYIYIERERERERERDNVKNYLKSFLLYIYIYIYIYIGCLDIHGTHVTENNSTNNKVVFFFVSDLKIYAIKTINLRSKSLRQERKFFFASQLIWGEYYSKLYKQNFAGNLTLIIIIPRKAKIIVTYTNFKPQSQ